MNLKKIALATIAGTALLATAPAFADNDRHWRGHGHGHGDGWKHGHKQYRHGHYVPQRVVVVRPAPVYHYDYAPPRPVYYSAPVYVAPRPVIVYRQPGLSVSLGF